MKCSQLAAVRASAAAGRAVLRHELALLVGEYIVAVDGERHRLVGGEDIDVDDVDLSRHVLPHNSDDGVGEFVGIRTLAGGDRDLQYRLVVVVGREGGLDASDARDESAALKSRGDL